MNWIREHKLIAGILAILIILVILFLVSVFFGGTLVSKGIIKVDSVIAGNIYSFTQEVKENIYGIFNYRQLQEKIDKLEEENLELKKEITQIQLNKEELKELKDLAGILNYEYTDADFDIVSCNITSYDGSNWTRVFTIDRGTEVGIKVGDAVINGMGLVGRVEEVGHKWAKVVTLIDEDLNVSFKLARSMKQLGVANGGADGTLIGYMMDAESTVSEGDILITSGLGVYPPGIELGSVKSVEYNSNTLLKEVVIEPSVEFNGLDKVAVIR